MSRPNQEIAKIFIAEYKLVRDELLERTKFRDNLPLISLGFFGAIIAFGLGDLINLDYSAILLKSSNNPISSLALYVLPYVSMVLGFFWWSVELKVITLVRSAISIADEVNKILPNDGENVLLHAGRAPK